MPGWGWRKGQSLSFLLAGGMVCMAALVGSWPWLLRIWPGGWGLSVVWGCENFSPGCGSLQQRILPVCPKAGRVGRRPVVQHLGVCWVRAQLTGGWETVSLSCSSLIHSVPWSGFAAPRHLHSVYWFALRVTHSELSVSGWFHSCFGFHILRPDFGVSVGSVCVDFGVLLRHRSHIQDWK